MTDAKKLKKLRDVSLIDIYAAVLSAIPSDVYINYLNATTAEDFLKIFRRLFSTGGGIRQTKYSENDVREAILAMEYCEVDKFKKSRIGRDFINAQAELQEAVLTHKIYNPIWQDKALEGFAIRLSAWSIPTIAKTDPFACLVMRLVFDAINGERISQCEAPGCEKFFKAYRSGKTQKYCSSTCRVRAFRKK